MEIVLDKSYLEARSSSDILELCEQHTVLFTETLFFELLTTSEDQRVRCIQKFPTSGNPVLLIPRSGPLLDYEKRNRAPAVPLSAHRFKALFSQFIEDLSAPGLPLLAHQAEALVDWKAEVEAAVVQFHGLAASISVWCPDIRELAGEALQAQCSSLKQEAASNPDIVRGIYQALDLREFPDPIVLDPSWVIFRWVQTHILFYLDHITRYGVSGPTNIPKRIEHDYHDIEYALAGAISGGLASRDNGVISNFSLMNPDGLVLQ